MQGLWDSWANVVKGGEQEVTQRELLVLRKCFRGKPRVERALMDRGGRAKGREDSMGDIGAGGEFLEKNR